MGRHCFEVLGGRDVWGNRFCSPSCPVAAMARQDEPVSAYELRTATGANGSRRPVTLNVTVIRIPGPSPETFTLVHLLQEIDEEARVSRAQATDASGWPPLPSRTRCGARRSTSSSPPFTSGLRRRR